ncbi:MAG: motility protein A [Acidobacteria bacterium]|nr:MAG: motility protein A [Acidobacteriota bacterium]
MELGTIAGLGLGLTLIAIAIVIGGNPVIFVDVQSLLIVIGGGVIAAPMIAYPLSHVKGMVSIVMKAVIVKAKDPVESIKFIIELAQKARKESLLALENVEIEDEFLKKGIGLAVDGTEPAIIKGVLKAEMTYIQKRHEDGKAVLETIGDMAPAFGMIGTLVGLVNMLANLSDPSAIGPAMAVAILTTLYGAVAANVFALPLANKLAWYDAEETLQMEIVIEGINSILEGEHPAIAEQKLMSFLPASKREQG